MSTLDVGLIPASNGRRAIRRSLAYGLTFIAGFLIGTGALWALANHALPVYHSVGVRQTFIAEQEFLAVRAEREGDMLRALFHRWNAVDAQSDRWMMMHKRLADSTWYPVDVLFAYWLVVEPNMRNERGYRRLEGIQRGHLAWLLEANGQRSLAQSEWEKAKVLLRQTSVAETREVIDSLRELHSSETHLEAEQVILGL